VYADVHLEPGARVSLPVPQALNALVYLYEGVASLVSEDRNQTLAPSSANILDHGDEVLIESGKAGAKLLLIAGRPIGEPVVQYGPFVMNTTAEIEQALADYRDGTLTA
jgi:redox-sensitive bicupin YhaK (pirin superfamily)